MKLLVTITLAVLAAASGVTAQDTLLIKTYRTVDVCSSEQRWLIAPYLGNMRSQDSLASFDITIGYDTAVIRPTDVLTENTLSFAMFFPAQMSLVVPGEMRIAAFNVNRYLVGDKPLFAVSGNFTGSCGDSVELSFPWPPTFNEEFKKRITILQSERVAVVARATTDPQLGMNFEQDSVTIDGIGSHGTINARVEAGGRVPKAAELVWWLSDSVSAELENVEVVGATVLDVERRRGEIRTIVQMESTQLPTASIVLKNATTDSIRSVVVYSQLNSLDSCSCVKSQRIDSLVVVLSNPIVSVSSPVDDSYERLVVTTTTATYHCYHGQTNEIEVFDVTGQRVAKQQANGQSSNTMSIENLPAGPYIIVGTCGVKTFVNLNLK